jgi:phosphoribosylanthranilate isomerase
MNYPFILKFSKITNLSDARYAAGAWADFVGFCFDPSLPEYLEPNKAKEIAGWINGPLLVGEFGMQPVEWISDFVKAIPLKAVQIPASYTDETIFNLGLRILVKVSEPIQSPIMQNTDIFVAENEATYQFLKSNYEQPVIFSFKDVHENVEKYDGIELDGIMEDKPGTRNHGMWNDILEPYLG